MSLKFWEEFGINLVGILMKRNSFGNESPVEMMKMEVFAANFDEQISSGLKTMWKNVGAFLSAKLKKKKVPEPVWQSTFAGDTLTAHLFHVISKLRFSIILIHSINKYVCNFDSQLTTTCCW